MSRARVERIKKFLKMGTMNKILLLIAIFLLLFTVTMIVVFIKTGAIPDTLVTCVFAACTGEVSVCGWIRNTKNKIAGINNEMD